MFHRRTLSSVIALLFSTDGHVEYHVLVGVLGLFNLAARHIHIQLQQLMKHDVQQLITVDRGVLRDLQHVVQVTGHLVGWFLVVRKVFPQLR
uniref:Putative secreted protein n=1 Tax=Anopheles triannulatus TaxID=58253 RepID=A0A2M4B3H8_9DIPT